MCVVALCVPVCVGSLQEEGKPSFFVPSTCDSHMIDVRMHTHTRTGTVATRMESAKFTASVKVTS